MRMLVIQEVAELLRVPSARVYSLVRTGVLPAVKVGRQIRVPEQSLRQWIAEGGRGLSPEDGR